MPGPLHPSNTRPTSPAFSEATTRASQFDLDGTIITRADLRTSLQTYEQLLSASSVYRAALLNLSQATASFASAIQACAGLKGCEFLTASRQGAAAGFHHLFANHLHVLSDAVERQSERILSHKLADYRNCVSERSENYEKVLREKSRVIRQTEERNIRMGRRKERNMTSFRATLSILQAQVDDIDRLKVEHYREVEEYERQFSELVQSHVALVVRSTFEVFERLTAKSTDPVLEPMLQSIPDPFDTYGPPNPEGAIFSVLQPLTILTDSSPSTPHEAEPASTTSPAWANTMTSFSYQNGEDYPTSLETIQDSQDSLKSPFSISSSSSHTAPLISKPLPTIHRSYITAESTAGEPLLPPMTDSVTTPTGNSSSPFPSLEELSLRFSDETVRGRPVA